MTSTVTGSSLRKEQNLGLFIDSFHRATTTHIACTKFIIFFFFFLQKSRHLLHYRSPGVSRFFCPAGQQIFSNVLHIISQFYLVGVFLSVSKWVIPPYPSSPPLSLLPPYPSSSISVSYFFLHVTSYFSPHSSSEICYEHFFYNHQFKKVEFF